MMLSALEVLKKPYQSSLVLKQTVDDVNCVSFFEPINAITPFEQVLAVPDLEFLARFQRQQGREIIKEQLW